MMYAFILVCENFSLVRHFHVLTVCAFPSSFPPCRGPHRRKTSDFSRFTFQFLIHCARNCPLSVAILPTICSHTRPILCFVLRSIILTTMKFSIAVLLAALAFVSAQESDLKSRLLEHRDDQFRDNKVRTTKDSRYFFFGHQAC